MGQIKLIAGKNVSLKEELNKEQEYNKIQYKKMQEFVENIVIIHTSELLLISI